MRQKGQVKTEEGVNCNSDVENIHLPLGELSVQSPYHKKNKVKKAERPLFTLEIGQMNITLQK